MNENGKLLCERNVMACNGNAKQQYGSNGRMASQKEQSRWIGDSNGVGAAIDCRSGKIDGAIVTNVVVVGSEPIGNGKNDKRKRSARCFGFWSLLLLFCCPNKVRMVEIVRGQWFSTIRPVR